ncbi:FtsK/SpoIIIE domain-containing protein [Microbacterium sp. NPDC057407]|uniref:FtsK/SpoIIIE domain-containing protein n=1 Tax=Microbacterium sp. NPDC057407 TaxID=3346120 RepID=UPI00366D3437
MTAPPAGFPAIGDLAEPLTLPAPWSPPGRPALPVVAAIVPLLGAVGLWLVTGSAMSLWLALLGPLIATATFADAARSARRERRRHESEAQRERSSISRAIEQRHELERQRAWARHPDVASLIARDDDVWRAAPERLDALVVGDGEVPSVVRVTGGLGDDADAALRAQAGRLSHAPVVVPASAGIVVVGPPVIAAAVQRALTLQLCLAMPPGGLAVATASGDELAWAARLPHAATAGTRVLAVVGPGEPVPAEADLAVARALPGEPLPPRCGVVLTVSSPEVARLEYAGHATPVRVEALARDQAESIADGLRVRAERTLGLALGSAGAISLSEVVDDAGPREDGSLPAVLGRHGARPAIVDLVADGPHAIVAGVTGSGKSELLITWILSLCRTHSPRDVVFLLADFKGGTAFDALTGVPHVTGVITDLDGTGARRAIESLRAEIRTREGAIAGAGARDIRDARVSLPRLVVVVDEFAALLGDHPELHAVFTDVAARGRALGIHLVIGTQRAAGVIRESLLANCPLRISLRVTDAADSRAVLGADDAAHLPGGSAGRGHAYVRRAGDTAPQRVRIALSDDTDVVAASGHAEVHAIRRPWLPALPSLLPLDDLRSRHAAPGGLLLGLGDEPDLQRQTPVVIEAADRGVLIVGGPRSGVTNAVELIAAQAGSDALRFPAEPEGVWDAAAALVAQPPAPGTVVCIDDLDALTARLPPDHAHVVAERLDTVIRGTGPGGYLVVAGAHRLSGPLVRLMELLPRRVRLPFPTRSEHLAAGGDIQQFAAGAPPGRGDADGIVLQTALAPPTTPGAPPTAADDWAPTSPLTGFVTRRSPAARAALEAWEQRGIRCVSIDAYATDPPVAGDPLVVVGEPDDWQRHWRLLADVRGDHDLVVDATCGPELRLLTGAREVPPYCEPGRGRAWLIAAGAEPARIVLPARQIRPVRPAGNLDRPRPRP